MKKKNKKASEQIKELKKIYSILKNARPSEASKFILSDLRAKKEKYNIKD